MKRISAIAALVGSLGLLYSCGGDITPDESGKEPGKEQEEAYVDASTTIGGHEAVDLGTGILWATTNLGASEPQDYGKYFAWGETETKSEYKWSNYKWSEGLDPENWSEPNDVKMTKYCLIDSYASVKKDGLKVLEPQDDAAVQSWGNGWRMPTQQEVSELLNKCEWEWNRLEGTGIYGYIITSPKTKKSIFIPAAGSQTYQGPNGSTFRCTYWTSSLHDKNEQYYAYSFVYLNEGQIGTEYISQTYRYMGMTIRPVCDKAKN